MNETKEHTLRDVSNGQRITESNNDLPIGNGTQETEKVMRPKNEVVVMNETPLVLSEEQSTKLKKESLDSMKLLNLSANHMLNTLESCVTDKEIQQAKNGGPRTDLYRLEIAIKSGNAIANLMQTQNNLLKSLAILTKGK